MVRETERGRMAAEAAFGEDSLALAQKKMRDIALTLRTQAKLLTSLADAIEYDTYRKIVETKEGNGKTQSAGT